MGIVIIAILIFGTLILVHELGHYLFARLFDVEITEFSIGMGPKLFSKVSKKTKIRYSLRALPIGGYVAMVGENEECSDNPRAFGNKKAWQKLIITAAGAGVNILIGFILMSIYTVATPTYGGNQVAGYYEVYINEEHSLYGNNSAFRENDIILSLDGIAASSIDEFENAYAVSLRDSKEGIVPVKVRIIRDGEEIEQKAYISAKTENDTQGSEYAELVNGNDRVTVRSHGQIKSLDKIVKIGNASVSTAQEINYEIGMNGYLPIDVTVIRDGEKLLLHDVEFATYEEQDVVMGEHCFSIFKLEKNFENVVNVAFRQCRNSVKMVFDSLFGILSGRFGIRSVSGVVGTTEAIGEAASYGITTLLYFCALISVNLGIFNLFPLPALDGGRIVFHILEIIRGKPVDQKYEAAIHGIGMIFLLILVAVITVSDIIKLF